MTLKAFNQEVIDHSLHVRLNKLLKIVRLDSSCAANIHQNLGGQER